MSAGHGLGKPELVHILEGSVKYGESKLEEHDKMLRWVERQRKEMIAEQIASVHATRDIDRPCNMPTTTSPCRPKRKLRLRSPLGPVRSAVSKKPSPKQGSLRQSKRDALQSAEHVTAATKAPRRSKRIADLKDKSFQCDIKSTPLRRPLSVAGAKIAHARKSRQPASAHVNPRLQLTGRSTRPKALEQPSSRVTKRRSGRERRNLRD